MNFEIISLLISLLALIFSLYNFYLEYKTDKVNRTVETFAKLKVEVLDETDQMKPQDIEDSYNKKNNPAFTKTKIKSDIARIDMFCLLVLNNVYDYKIFQKLNNGFINGHSMIKKYELILKKMRSKNRGYYNSLETMIGKLNNNKYTWK